MSSRSSASHDHTANRFYRRYLGRSARHFSAVALLAAVGVSSHTLDASPRHPPARDAKVRAPSAAPRAAAPSVRLTNASANPLRVEIRVGSSLTCDGARNAAERTLPPGRSWLVAADSPICWRSVVDRALTGSMLTQWQRRALLPAEHIEVPLSLPR